MAALNSAEMALAWVSILRMLWPQAQRTAARCAIGPSTAPDLGHHFDLIQCLCQFVAYGFAGMERAPVMKPSLMVTATETMVATA